MTMDIDFSHIESSNPHPTGTERLVYNVANNGPDDPGHQDVVKMWDSNGGVHIGQD